MRVDLTPKCVAAIAARGAREQNFMKLMQQINQIDLKSTERLGRSNEKNNLAVQIIGCSRTEF